MSAVVGVDVQISFTATEMFVLRVLKHRALMCWCTGGLCWHVTSVVTTSLLLIDADGIWIAWGVASRLAVVHKEN